MTPLSTRMVEAAAEAIAKACGYEWELLSNLGRAGYSDLARAALTAVAPLMAQAEREACAMEADGAGQGRAGTVIAAAIRALDGGHHAMTDPQRCEPPEHLRGVDGLPCWLKRQDGDAMLAVWRNYPFDHWERMGTDDTGLPDGWLADEGWRYLAPVAPPDVVRALVEALERIAEGDHPEGTSLAVNNNYRELESRLRAIARAALALYRGDVA